MMKNGENTTEARRTQKTKTQEIKSWETKIQEIKAQKTKTRQQETGDAKGRECLEETVTAQEECMSGEAPDVVVQRTYKARLFEMIFSDRKELLSLYNAVNGTDYKDPELLEINTLENAIYMSMKNDLSFLIDSRLYLYEHQSTYSPNLPLRYLMYVTELYSGMTGDCNLYGTKAVKLPTPRFIIFYNGVQEHPDREILRLSDLFTVKEENPALELEALMLNINPGHNDKLLGSCKTLRDYSEYTARVREYAAKMELKDAVERAITECIRDDILADFLRKNRMEAKSMSIYEYDEEKHMRQVKEEGREEGIRAFVELCKELGMSETVTIDKLGEHLGISEEEAERYVSETELFGNKKENTRSRSIYEYDEEKHLRQVKEEGEHLFALLTTQLLKDSRLEDLQRAAEDEIFRKKLYLEYDIRS